MSDVRKNSLRVFVRPHKHTRKCVLFALAACSFIVFFCFLHSYISTIAIDGTSQAKNAIATVANAGAEKDVAFVSDAEVLDTDGIMGASKKQKLLRRSHENLLHFPESISSLNAMLKGFIPWAAGFSFGFLGSIPIAGPTSAMVVRLGLQGKYRAGLTTAFGGAVAEAVYAGIAFWGFGSFLAGTELLLPISKFLGAVLLTIIGIVFLRSDFLPSPGATENGIDRKSRKRNRNDILKNALMGLTMSGVNPALLATYTAAIASIYGTGILTFNFLLAIFFSCGVGCGIYTWFFILISLLRRYRKALERQTVKLIMKAMGVFMIILGMICAKSSISYYMTVN